MYGACRTVIISHTKLFDNRTNNTTSHRVPKKSLPNGYSCQLFPTPTKNSTELVLHDVVKNKEDNLCRVNWNEHSRKKN